MSSSPACACCVCPVHGPARFEAHPSDRAGWADPAREYLDSVVNWLDGPEAMGAGHGDLEARLQVYSREQYRLLLQGHLDERARLEKRRGGVTGSDGVPRPRVENGHRRELTTVLGPVTVTRKAYRASAGTGDVGTGTTSPTASDTQPGPASDGTGEVVGEVVPGLGFGHAGQGAAQRDPLVEGGEGAEFDPPTQGGLAEQQPGERGDAVHLAVGEQPELFELVGGKQMRLVDGDDDGTAAFVFLGGEVVHGLGDQGRGVEAGDPAEAADQGGVEAAGADLTGDDPERGFADAPADPGDGFGVPAVAVQHRRHEVAAEWGDMTNRVRPASE